MVSLKRIKAMIKTVGVYIVDTTADIPEPNLLRDSRNKPSASNIPINPLNASVKISCWEKLGEGMEKRTIVKIKPKFLVFYKYISSGLPSVENFKDRMCNIKNL